MELLKLVQQSNDEKREILDALNVELKAYVQTLEQRIEEMSFISKIISEVGI